MTYEERETFWLDMPEPAPQREFIAIIGGYEIMSNGENCWQEFVTDKVKVIVPSGGPFGWGEQAAIDAQIALSHPGFTVVETFPAKVDYSEEF